MGRQVLVLAVVLAVAILALPVAGGAAPAGGVSVNGGGVAQNNNSGLGDLLVSGGFDAKDFGNGVTGQLQFKSVDAATGALIARIHGMAVCIRETTGVVAGGQGWELRFVITNATGPFAPPPGLFFSAFVQDNPGGIDLVDESFDDLFNPFCGDNDDDVSWEPLLHGNITVHS